MAALEVQGGFIHMSDTLAWMAEELGPLSLQMLSSLYSG